MTLDIATSLESPVVLTVLGALAAGLLYTLGRELRKIPAKLTVLMATAFLDMVGLLIVVPILPFYAGWEPRGSPSPACISVSAPWSRCSSRRSPSRSW
jgi:hypothetical protein